MAKQRQKKLPRKTPQEYLLEEEALSSNQEPRIPVILCLDCSYSMRQKRRLDRAIEGLKKFCEDIYKDEISRDAMELCIISYGGNEAQVLQDFATVDNILERGLPKLEAGGNTPLADAVLTALDALEARRERYRDNGITCYRPWLILIGDDDDSDDMGLNYEDREELVTLRGQLRGETDRKHLKVMCVTVGDVRQMTNAPLRRLSPDGKVYSLKELNFQNFFMWLSRSIEQTSQSLGGEDIRYEADVAWGELLLSGEEEK